MRNLGLEACREESLEKIVDHLEQEARMILPGIQALFGFQLIAVFNSTFSNLPETIKYLHLSALLCTSLAIALVLMPAAYHRQAETTQVSGYFARFSTVVLTYSLLPLAVGLSLDLYIIAMIITASKIISTVIGLSSIFIFISAWYIFPRMKKIN